MHGVDRGDVREQVAAPPVARLREAVGRVFQGPELGRVVGRGVDVEEVVELVAAVDGRAAPARAAGIPADDVEAVA